MLVPEDRGGGSVSDNGVYDAALIAYERGGALQPGGFVGTNVVAYALAAGGSEDHQAKVLPALVAGETTATWAVTGSRSGRLRRPASGPSRSGNWVLSGTKTFVVDPARSEWILVSAAGDNGPVQALVRSDASGVSIRPLEGLDITRRFGEVQLDEVEVSQSALVGTPETTAALVDKQLQIACVLTVAESVGAMDHDFDMAVQYAKDRIAFGRPIGSFQAIKHLLADTSLMLEMSKAIGWRRPHSVGAGRRRRRWRRPAWPRPSWATAGIDLAQNCFQVFGGIGYTWEHDQHLYLRRLTTDAALFGDPAWHRERLCQLSGL